ncbi:alpha-1,2-fucosyltransferase [Micrococcus luteus]|nr:alpha-1,2-fucosyltransferase [Micrococcus luteus]
MRISHAPRHLAALALRTVRHREPAVIWGNEPMNGGNFLFLWATAWARHRATGTRWVVRYKPKMQPWLQEFPALWRLTVKEEDVSFLQPRTVEWGHDINEDFLYPDLKAFCREVLLAGSDFPRRWGTVVPDATVVNVRRGDYYSVPEHRAKYGMDIRGYLSAALRALGAPADSPVVLVSDDPAWCVENLSDLFGDASVTTMPEPHDMFQDLAQLSAARRLILANSTFSYWAGYLATSRPRGERPERVVAPLFFGRHYPYGESALLLPEWLAIPADEYEQER